jgi:3-isopropylmalate dehydrogenase
MGQGALRGRPEAGLLRLRKDLGLFANIRPAICYPALADSSSLKREVVEGLDIIILRELTGGVYFGEPKTITDLGNGQKRAVDTQVYDTYEIERIARVGFELARKRRNKVTSMEKRNVMKTGVLWHEVVEDQVHKREYKDVSSSTCWPMPAACSWCAGRNSSTSSSPIICSATCCPMSRRC